MQQYVGTMEAQGGGDGPEAVTAAVDDARRLPWRPNATKVAVLIADAPPHGLEPGGDGFPNGDPEGRDPLDIARQMAGGGITVYAVGCEPALGGYRFARDFMCSLAEITGGQAVALSCADRLADVIINGSAEEISLTRLTREVEHEVERVRVAATGPIDEEELQMQACLNLQSRGVKSKQMRHDGAMKQQNASVWKGATSLAAAKMELCKTVAPGDLAEDMLSDYMDDDDLVKSSKSFSRPSRAAKGLSWLMSPFTRESTTAAAPTPEFATRSASCKARRSGPMVLSGPVPPKKKAPAPMLRKAMPLSPGGFGEVMAASAPEEAKSLESNVLVEDEISYNQVKRIMARKSAK
jgi:hypothetical protein